MLKSKETKKYTFQVNFKFINEQFLPSTTIDEALHELQNHRKYIDENSYVIFMGRILENNLTFEDLFKNIVDVDEQPLIIENKKPDLIKISLNFQFEVKDINENDIKNMQMVYPLEAMNVHYWGSILSGQEFDNITLTLDDKLLNDDDLIEYDDSEIKVNLISAKSEIKDELSKTDSKDDSDENEESEIGKSENYFIGEDEEKITKFFHYLVKMNFHSLTKLQIQRQINCYVRKY